MSDIHFNPNDTVVVSILDLTEPAFDWAIGQAIGESLSVDIETGYHGAWITSNDHYNAIGEPKSWGPCSDWSLTGPRIFEKKVATYTKSDGMTWYARSFISPTVIYSGQDPLTAACKVMVFEHFGDQVSVPRQLQELVQLRSEFLVSRKQSAVQERQLDKEEQLGALGQHLVKA